MDLQDLELKGVREFMMDEIKLDIDKNVLYMSKRLKSGFESNYISLLQDAAVDGDSNSFAQCILNEKCLASMEPNPRNKDKMKKVPWNAHITLAEGEFNRFYIRALCRKAIEEGHELEIYRAKRVDRPRSASQALLGKTADPNELLEELRVKIGVDNVLGIPPGPNSGLSVRIIK